MFLREHVPELLHELQSDLALVTLFCSCEYLDEIVAFDEILVRMTLAALTQSRIGPCISNTGAAANWWRAASSGSPVCAGNKARWPPRRRCLSACGEALRNFEA